MSKEYENAETRVGLPPLLLAGCLDCLDLYFSEPRVVQARMAAHVPEEAYALTRKLD